MTTEFSIYRPSDLHVHFRQDEMLALVAPYSRDLEYVLAMPNTLNPIILTSAEATPYIQQIYDAFGGKDFTSYVLMSLKVLDEGLNKTTPEIIADAARYNDIKSIKLYPRGATTHAGDGIKDYDAIYPALATAEEYGIMICVHGEDPGTTTMKRENVFLEKTFSKMVEAFPKARFVLEHVSTKAGIEFVQQAPSNVAATITAHHAAFTIDDFEGGLVRVTLACKPKIKEPDDRKAIVSAMLSGDGKFFYGSDSAPWQTEKKYCYDCCSGVFSAPYGIELIISLFEKEYGSMTDVAIHNLEKFLSLNGPSHYKLRLPKEKVTFFKEEWNTLPVYPKNHFIDELTIPGVQTAINWKRKGKFYE